MKTKILIKRALLLSLVLTLLFAIPTLAASNKTKALKAYSKFLAKHESSFLIKIPSYGDYSQKNKENAQSAAFFLTVDMDKNGVPELVTQHVVGFKHSILYVYRYKNGKVKRVKNRAIPRDKTEPYMIPAPTYTAATTWSGLSVWECKKKHLHIAMMSGAGRDEYTYYMKGGKLKLFTHAQEHYNTSGYRYSYKGKKVSAAKYNSAIKGCISKGWMENNNTFGRKKKLK